MAQGQNEHVDPKTLSEHQIAVAFRNHCRAMGSRPYYLADELEYAKDDPEGIVAWRVPDQEGDDALRAYHKRGQK